MNNKSQEILSQITIFNKYAKFVPDKGRRENWGEICDRYESMMTEKYPQLAEEITKNMLSVRNKKVLPSMRAMQFAGPAITKNNSRLFNCAYLPIDDHRAFSEAMFLLLGGTGVGYSVQSHHVDQLPEILKPTKDKKFLIGDSLEGWADAIKALIKSYLGLSKTRPRFDFSDIRPKGARLVTAGGKAPGPAPLRACLAKIEGILESKVNGSKLSPLECHDILCHIANAVLSGGIRRSAMIALFDFDDKEMLECKYGNWWETNEQRGRANNSAVIVRGRIRKSEFDQIWKKIEMSNAGEPGLYFTNDKEYGTNPCCEISLRPFQFCNLSEVNVSDIVDEADLAKRVEIAAFFGTLQAGFTDFHYLRSIWRTNTEKDALIGVGMTGIASGEILKYDLNKFANLAKDVNEKTAYRIGINKAARVTTIKPSGTTSCVLGTSSGIHAWHSQYYIRRIRIMKNDPLYTYLSIYHPDLIEDDKLRSHDTAVISIPQMAPEGSILRTESAIDLLERVKKFNLKWVKSGHRKGPNTNNVSATISVNKDSYYAYAEGKFYSGNTKEDPNAFDEWEVVGEWMWANRNTFNGLSVLPYSDHSYIQAPFEDCTKEEYERLSSKLSDLDLNMVIEVDDNTDLAGEQACGGNGCELK